MRSNYTCARSGPKHRPASVDALFAGHALPKSKPALDEVREYIRGLERRDDSLHAEVERLQERQAAVAYEAALLIRLDDDSDYRSGLFEVVRELDPEQAQRIEDGTWRSNPEDNA